MRAREGMVAGGEDVVLLLISSIDLCKDFDFSGVPLSELSTSNLERRENLGTVKLRQESRSRHEMHETSKQSERWKWLCKTYI